jgi:hypothetical protein
MNVDNLEALRQEWRIMYRETLPQHARQNDWPIWQDHCVARIVYDHVAGAKWDTVWQKPAIHNLDQQQLKACMATAEKLVKGALSAEDLNHQSLIYRGKL